MKGAAMAMNEAREYRPRQNDNWGKRIGTWSLIAAALPVLGAGLLKSVEIWKTPDRMDVLAKQQEKMDKEQVALKASQKEMRDGLNRILSAMHLEPIKENKEKDSQP